MDNYRGILFLEGWLQDVGTVEEQLQSTVGDYLAGFREV